MIAVRPLFQWQPSLQPLMSASVRRAAFSGIPTASPGVTLRPNSGSAAATAEMFTSAMLVFVLEFNASMYWFAMNSSAKTNIAEVNISAVAAADPLFGLNVTPGEAVGIPLNAARRTDALIKGCKEGCLSESGRTAIMRLVSEQ